MNTARGLGARIVATLRDRFGGTLTRPPKPTKGDFLSGLTSGIASIHDGMASGVIAGINPVYGLSTPMVATPVAALTVSTQLMVVNTTSAMILVAADGLGDHTWLVNNNATTEAVHVFIPGVSMVMDKGLGSF